MENVLAVHRNAGDISNAEVLGVLEILKHNILRETEEMLEEEDDENEEWKNDKN